MGGCDAAADWYLIEPAASRVVGRPVETGDVRFEDDAGCPVEEVDAGESYGRAGHVEKLDEAEPDGVDPPWPAGGEHAHRSLLALQQEGNPPERRVPGSASLWSQVSSQA